MKEQFLVTAVVLSYWTVSTAYVFVNKQLVSGINGLVDISIFIAWFQVLSGFIILLAARTVAKCCKLPWTDLSSLSLDQRRLLTLGSVASSTAYITSLIFNSLLLKYISVSFYQIARSLTIIFVILLSKVLLHDQLLMSTMIACILIVAGFYIGVHEEIVINGVQLRGIFYGSLCSFFSALSSTLCKMLQKKEKINSLQFTYNVLATGTIILAPVVLGSSQLQNVLYSPLATDWFFWSMMLLSGLTCLMVGWISTLQITLTSPLTYIISTNSKSVIQTLLAVIWNNETRSIVWWAGNSFICIGVFMYSSVGYFKTQRVKAKL
ncbi:GDP-fucose transporter 1-like [Physella acuta]|uniref:GDP-fucose transporter 1-like n=1 Tax=Physella acuta TaxID=109671 RepID=UPI0027DE239E|nr:GDP-fucose transporter 1-like [Physella acuta]